MEYYNLSPVTFLLRMIEVFSQMTLVLVISNAKVKLKNFLFVSLMLSVLFEVIKISLPQYLTATIASIISILALIFLLKIDTKKAIFSYLITIITVAIVDCLIALATLNIGNFSNLNEVAQSENLMLLGNSLVSAVVFFIAIIINFVNQNKHENTVSDLKSSINIATLIITFFLLIPNIIMIIYYHTNKKLPITIILVNILAIIATFFISIFNTQRGIKFIQNEEELITEKTYNKALQDLVDSLKTFKHDYNNTIQTMHGYIFMKDMDGLTEYFEDVMKEAKTITALDKLNSELFNDPSLFSLITAKFEYAKKNNVTMTFDMHEKFNNLDIKSYDFSRILGILLDNAVEAATISENKFVKIYTVKENEKVTIEISNSFSPTELNVEDMDKKGTSSKGENRGLGLYKVKDILSKYPQIIHEVTASNNVFLQKLVIDKVKLPIS